MAGFLSTALDALKDDLVKAYFQIEQPQLPGEHAVIPVRFNPTQYQLQKQNTYAEIGIPGLETPPIQYVRGACEKLTTELLVDTSDTLDNVRDKYVNRLRSLLNINSELHAPPVVRLVWDKDVFRGVLESLSVTYLLFSPDGIPLRAKLNVSLKEYRTPKEQRDETPLYSPDREKTWTVERGDSLPNIAHRVYRRADAWRDIARANDIRDPRRLEPGIVLRIPRLR